ncbi:MAG: PTS sugar transporter subunit IIB [Anaerostipes sp.]|nr:PTS sugar transporter subunit IIB [Anaerostipes sp.]
MKRIMVVCGTGLGSSFMVEMNIKDILRKYNKEEFTVSHGAVFDVSQEDGDFFVIAKDLEDAMTGFEKLIVLNSIIDLDELEEKICKLF